VGNQGGIPQQEQQQQQQIPIPMLGQQRWWLRCRGLDWFGLDWMGWRLGMQFNMPENTYIRCELQKIPGQKGVYTHTKNWKSAKKTIIPEVKKPAVLVFFPPIGRGASVICIIRRFLQQRGATHTRRPRPLCI